MKNSHLSARPIPHADESPASILIRAAERNGYETVHNMIHFTGLNQKSMGLEILLNYLAKFLQLLGKLDLRAVNPEEVLARGGPRSKKMRKMMRYFYPPEFFRQDGIAYCPGCLHDKQYLRKLWIFRPYSICHLHGTPILTGCSTCGEEMNISRGKLCECSYCKSDIRHSLPARSNTQASWCFDFLHGEHALAEDFSTIFGWAKGLRSHGGLLKTDAEAAELTYLYFSDKSAFDEHLLKYVSHDGDNLKLKLLPLYRGSDAIKSYIEGFFERNKTGKDFSSRDLDVRLTLSEAATLHGLTTTTVQNLLRRVEENGVSKEAKLTVGRLLQLIEADNARKAAIQAQTLEGFLTIPDVAELLMVHSEIVRSIQKSGYLKFERHVFAGSLKYVTTRMLVEDFSKSYVLVGTLANKIDVNATDLTAKLGALGIHPVATPKNSSLKTCLFSASDVQGVTKDAVLAIQKCTTNAGRKPSGSLQKCAPTTKNVSIMDAAKQLDLSLQKVKTLLGKEHLVRAIESKPGTFITKTSLKALIQARDNDQYISVEDAATSLNTSVANLKREWISLGMVEYKDFTYWERVKKSDIQRILEIKSEYVNAADAGKMLGMHRTHVRNLAKQNLITPHLFGSTKQGRFYKISDVLKFK